MRVIGIDPSLLCTGYAVFDTYNLLDSGVIQTKLAGTERLVYIRDKVASLLTKHNIDYVCMENYGFGARGNAVFSIGELGGVLKVLFYEQKKPVILVAPTAVKKFLSGKGTLHKDAILLETYKRFGFDTRNHNIADAYCIGYIGCACVDYENFCKSNAPIYQKEVIKKILGQKEVVYDKSSDICESVHE